MQANETQKKENIGRKRAAESSLHLPAEVHLWDCFTGMMLLMPEQVPFSFMSCKLPDYFGFSFKEIENLKHTPKHFAK